MTVDAHLHIWRATTYANPGATIVSPYSHVPLELLKEYMEEHGVTRAVLVQPLYPGEDNSYVTDSAANEPDKFAAVCVVDPRFPDAAERLAYWVQERGCRGIRLRPRIAGEEEIFGAPSTFPLWETARASKTVVSVLANPEHLPALTRLADRFPDVAIVIDHMGHPNVAAGPQSPAFQALLDLARYPRVFVKVTGYYYSSQESYPWRDCWAFVRAIYDRFGAERLIWGSDFPHVLLKVGYRRNLLLQERYFPFLTSAEREQVMGENAARLYFPKERA